MNHEREFIRRFESLTGRHHLHTVFMDWLTCVSSALLVRQSPFEHDGEETYQKTADRYSADELRGFSELFGITILALESRYQDFLGHCFMAMDLGNKFQGQFFTPYHLSRLSAEMTFRELPDREIITIAEPACGSGGMVIAAMEVLQSRGIGYQTRTYTSATDVSELAARMCYIQLSILGIPARVYHGNTLSMEIRHVWPTLFFGNVCHKLNRHPAEQAAIQIHQSPEQLALF